MRTRNAQRATRNPQPATRNAQLLSNLLFQHLPQLFGERARVFRPLHHHPHLVLRPRVPDQDSSLAGQLRFCFFQRGLKPRPERDGLVLSRVAVGRTFVARPSLWGPSPRFIFDQSHVEQRLMQIDGDAEGVEVGVHRDLLVDGVLSTADFDPSAQSPSNTATAVESLI